MKNRDWHYAEQPHSATRARTSDSRASAKHKGGWICNLPVKIFLILGFTAFCGGCTVGPNFATPTPPVLPQSYVLVGQESAVPLDLWWQVFADEKLNLLVEKAYNNNLDTRVAYERIIEARSNLNLVSANQAPTVSTVNEYQYSLRSGNAQPFAGPNAQSPFDLFDAGLDASWQIDLFGKLRRSTEAAAAELAFEEHETQFVLQTLLSDIAQSYLQVRLLQNQLDLAQQSLAVQEQTAHLVNQRKEAGLSNELDLVQTRSLQQRVMALRADLKAQLEVELNRLSILVGEAPSFGIRDFVGFAQLPEIPPMAEVGFPAELMRRRPDVRRDEMALAAAVAQIGVAEADLYPQLTLLGTITVSAQNVSELFETDSLDFSVGPSLRWNILHFGRITSNIAVQESQCRQAFHAYQKTVIEAAREVEDALANHEGFRSQAALLSQAVEADEKAVELSLERYDAGKANFQRFLDAQQQLVVDLQQRANVHAQSIQQLIRLYNALGGGWQPGNGVPIEFQQVQYSDPNLIGTQQGTQQNHPIETFDFEQPQTLDPLGTHGQGQGEEVHFQPFDSNTSQSAPRQHTIFQQESDVAPPSPPAPLPSPESIDVFPAQEELQEMGLSLEDAFQPKKVPHKFPMP